MINTITDILKFGIALFLICATAVGVKVLLHTDNYAVIAIIVVIAYISLTYSKASK